MVNICILGAINWDINLFVERFPEIGEEVPVKKITRVPGGKAANVAVACARILGSNQVALIGCLGRDNIADQQIRILKDEGVVVSGIKIVDDAESGQAYILIDKNGRNVINTLFGANLKLVPRDLQGKHIYDLLREAHIIAVIDPPFETIDAAFNTAKQEGKITLWDAGVRSMLGIRKLTRIIENLDYLVVNQVEVKNITGEQDPVKAWMELSKINRQLKLIVKLGEKGCSMVSSGQTITVPRINLEKLGFKVVNTVGCGDAFLGVFVASKSQGLNDDECLERANLAGALKASKSETRGSPTKQEFEKYLNYKEAGVVNYF
ncbi:MAG: PfkB family carbohydrate kinase [Candidatus Bathyarchaeia archaeon]